MTSPFFGPILLGRFPVERFPEKIFLGRVGPEAKRASLRAAGYDDAAPGDSSLGRNFLASIFLGRCPL
jgi:hypothetical protein